MDLLIWNFCNTEALHAHKKERGWEGEPGFIAHVWRWRRWKKVRPVRCCVWTGCLGLAESPDGSSVHFIILSFSRGLAVCVHMCVWQPWWPPRTHVIAWAAPQLMDAIDCPVLLLYGTPPNLLSPRIKGGTMTLPLFKIATSAQLKFSLLFIITLFKYTSFTSNCPLCFPELSYPSSLLLLFAPLIAFSVSPAIKMIGDCVMYINVLVLRVVSLCMLLYFLVKKKKKL